MWRIYTALSCAPYDVIALFIALTFDASCIESIHVFLVFTVEIHTLNMITTRVGKVDLLFGVVVIHGVCACMVRRHAADYPTVKVIASDVEVIAEE